MASSAVASRLLSAVVTSLLVTSCGTTAHVVVRAAAPSDVAWQSSAKLGLWRDGDFDVFNNEWNAAQAGPQTVWADSYHSWGVVSTQPDTTSVKTYPCVQEDFTDTPLTSLRRLTSSFAESMPPAAADYDAEAAYDLWLDSYRDEVMVWVDNHGQQPAGIVSGEAVLAGQHFRVYRGSANMVSLVLSGTHESSGSVNLLLALRWLVGNGYLRSSDSLTQVNFGWEIASTDRIPLGFTLHRYSLSVVVHRPVAWAARGVSQSAAS